MFPGVSRHRTPAWLCDENKINYIDGWERLEATAGRAGDDVELFYAAVSVAEVVGKEPGDMLAALVDAFQTGQKNAQQYVHEAPEDSLWNTVIPDQAQRQLLESLPENTYTRPFFLGIWLPQGLLEASVEASPDDEPSSMLISGGLRATLRLRCFWDSKQSSANTLQLTIEMEVEMHTTKGHLTKVLNLDSSEEVTTQVIITLLDARLQQDLGTQLTTQKQIRLRSIYTEDAQDGGRRDPSAPQDVLEEKTKIHELLNAYIPKDTDYWSQESRTVVLELDVPVDVAEQPPDAVPVNTSATDTQDILSCIGETDKLPGVEANQQAVAHELLRRIMLILKLGPADNTPPTDDAAWMKASVKRLQQHFHQGMSFIIVGPKFQTLKRQTLERVFDAGLADEREPADVVMAYIESAKTRKAYDKFKEGVAREPNKLFVMIVDECHWGVTPAHAHDAFVNDWQEDELKRGELLESVNLVTLLVSATPYALLTNRSRIPEKYLVKRPEELNRDPIFQDITFQSNDIIVPSTSTSGTLERAGLTLTEAQLTRLRAVFNEAEGRDAVITELHVVDWTHCDMLDTPYRRIEDYISARNKLQLDHHGLVFDPILDKKLPAPKKKTKPTKQAAEEPGPPDQAADVLLLDYLMSMQYFRFFRMAEVDGIPNEHPRLLLLSKDNLKKCKSRIENADRVRLFWADLRQFVDSLPSARKTDLHRLLDNMKQIDEALAEKGWGTDLAMHSDITFDAETGAENVEAAQKVLMLKLFGESDRPIQQYMKEGSAFTESDRIVTSLVSLQPEEGTGDLRHPNVAVRGDMVVVRVSDVKEGKQIVGDLKTYLAHTMTCTLAGKSNRAGPLPLPWAGAGYQPDKRTLAWSLFDVFDDVGTGELLSRKVSPWSLARKMSKHHPARTDGFTAYATRCRVPESYSAFLDFKDTVSSKMNDPTIAGTGKRVKQNLQYMDLYGIPCMLFLCEKGRMGDTFPQTFSCLDLRIRTSKLTTTFVQEVGRVARYPAIDTDTTESIEVKPGTHGNLEMLTNALAYALFDTKTKRANYIASLQDPVPAVPGPQQPDERWSKKLRWEHPFFDDIAEQPFSDYGSVRPGTYAYKIKLQRLVLLARAVQMSLSGWLPAYQEMLTRPEGEFVQSQEGLKRIARLSQGVSEPCCEPILVYAEDTSTTLTIQDEEKVIQCINWDGRLTDEMDPFKSTARSAARYELSQGNYICFNSQGDRVSVRIKDGAITDYIKSGTSTFTNIIEQMSWRSQLLQPLPQPADAAQAPSKLPTARQQPAQPAGQRYLAETFQTAKMLQPMTHKLQQTVVPLVDKKLLGPRDLPTYGEFHPPNMSNEPTFRASEATWRVLQDRCQIELDGNGFIFKPQSSPPSATILQHWVFTHTFNRYHQYGHKQMFIDWSGAVNPGAFCVRVLVVRPDEEQLEGYTRLLQSYERVAAAERKLHPILIMTLPESVEVAGYGVRASSHPYTLTPALGCGYARLCIQIIAYMMRMDNVWIIDDNLRECRELDMEALLTGKELRQHMKPPAYCTFDAAMRTIEKQVINLAECNSEPNDDLKGQCESWGLSSRKGAIDTSPRDRNLVGVERGWEPWKVTHSAPSMFIMSIKNTVERGVYYPARVYHEDFEFCYMCEDAGLVVLKCSTVFHRKFLFAVRPDKASGDPKTPPTSSEVGDLEVTFTADGHAEVHKLLEPGYTFHRLAETDAQNLSQTTAYIKPLLHRPSIIYFGKASTQHRASWRGDGGHAAG
ncbi:hypothetical protein WJX72_012295 [[Myrmecia] bisecta]|uniref:GREB1-like circularly permuted SF2 helicase domain-containing protein n=1 Tax=[Myrmecia] bisecta TaxID=41462 RepID=A0AAW1Q501_9CHLO